MKKTLSVILKILVYILLFALGVLLGGLVMSSIVTSDDTNPLLHLALLFVGFIVVYNLCVVVHEGGHLLFGLLSGYRFSSFRIGSLMLIKRDGKMQLRTLKLAGTGGQCLMIPPEEREGKIPTVLYNLGGVFANIIFAAICLVVLLTLPYVNVLTQLIILAIAFSLLFAILNGVPMNMGVPNDGANALSLRKNPTAAKALRLQLLIAADNAAGVPLHQMPAEWFDLGDDADMTNPLCTAISVFACNRLMSEERIEDAGSEMQRLINSGANLVQIHRSLLTADRIYCTLVLDGKDAKIADLYTPEQKKFMLSMKSNPSIIRTEYTIALMRDKDENAAEKIKQSFEKRAKSYPYPQEIISERRLMEIVLEKYKSE